MGTGRRCGSSSVPASSSSAPRPRRPTGCVLCCSAVTTATDGAARRALTDARLDALARRRPSGDGGREQVIRQAEIRRLALALRAAGRQLKANRTQLRDLVTDVAPALLGRYGVGPVCAAQTIVSFSHPGRLRDDAAFAALAGVCPIPASSGRTVRHRLNRGGDRALNRAIHTIAISRMRSCPRTRAYITRRRAEGKTHRDIRRALKRYIARELYRHLTAAMGA
jgi:transposase